MERLTLPPAVHPAPPASDAPQARQTRIGVLYGLAAYGAWGLAPIYFKAVTLAAPLMEVMAHRVIWSVALMSLLMVRRRQWSVARRVLHDRRALWTLICTTLLVGGNWLIFIWANANGQVSQASLGYFINPLLSVLLGAVFLGERLRRGRRAGVALAGVGVAYLIVIEGTVPWVALGLASSFGLYGLLRKTVNVDALVGLTLEVLFLLPAALGYAVYLGVQGKAVFGMESMRASGLLALAGVMTSIPLLWFAHAARRLRLSTVGFLQYLAPSLQLLLAVTLYGEAFTRTDALAFGLIWAGCLVYSLDALHHARAAQPPRARPPA